MIYVQCTSTYPQIPPKFASWMVDRICSKLPMRAAKSFNLQITPEEQHLVWSPSSIEMAQTQIRSKGQSVGVTPKIIHLWLCIHMYCILYTYIYICKNSVHTVRIYVNPPRQKPSKPGWSKFPRPQAVSGHLVLQPCSKWAKQLRST